MEFMSISEASKRMKLRYSDVKRMIDTGALKSKVIGKTRRTTDIWISQITHDDVPNLLQDTNNSDKKVNSIADLYSYLDKIANTKTQGKKNVKNTQLIENKRDKRVIKNNFTREYINN